MEKNLHKRLKEAAIKLQREVTPHKGWGDIYYGFMKGAEYGYKEAIAQAKEWLQKNVPIIHTEEGDYVRVNIGHRNVPMNIYLADFEDAMDKLWEDEE